MIQFLKGLFNVSIHRKNTGPIVRIAFKVDANALGGIGIAHDSVMLLHGSYQVCKIFVPVVLDEEVIYDKGKGDATCLVVEIALNKSQTAIKRIKI